MVRSTTRRNVRKSFFVRSTGASYDEPPTGASGPPSRPGSPTQRAHALHFFRATGRSRPSAIDTLLHEAETCDADVVLSVYESRDDGAHRAFLSASVRSLITLVHGVRVRSDGPYLFRRRLFLPEELPPDSFFLNFEFPIRARAAGLRVRTVTIPCRRRFAGQSKSARLRRVQAVTSDLLELRMRRLRASLERALGRRLA